MDSGQLFFNQCKARSLRGCVILYRAKRSINAEEAERAVSSLSGHPPLILFENAFYQKRAVLDLCCSLSPEDHQTISCDVMPQESNWTEENHLQLLYQLSCSCHLFVVHVFFQKVGSQGMKPMGKIHATSVS